MTQNKSTPFLPLTLFADKKNEHSTIYRNSSNIGALEKLIERVILIGSRLIIIQN